ncbi:hypothetical protein NPIL_426401 [Nephila pilipes]|uniref:Uncharacterized protein n=1 Tax=Nephila pilipes TaxID=299642 RepID=A0A8X6Q3V7_NEPPI|nr:hypothetical protein NPIL_426401 [Nephila pilipes]
MTRAVYCSIENGTLHISVEKIACGVIAASLSTRPNGVPYHKWVGSGAPSMEQGFKNRWFCHSTRPSQGIVTRTDRSMGAERGHYLF